MLSAWKSSARPAQEFHGSPEGDVLTVSRWVGKETLKKKILALNRLMLTHLRMCREPSLSGPIRLRSLPTSGRPRSLLKWQPDELELPKGRVNRQAASPNVLRAKMPAARLASALLPSSRRLPASPPPSGGPRPPRAAPHAWSPRPGGHPAPSPAGEGPPGPGARSLSTNGSGRMPGMRDEPRAISVWRERIAIFSGSTG